MEMAKEIMNLIYVGVGILAAGIPLIITLVMLFKNKSLSEAWKTIQVMADAAMVEAEKSAASGADKKKIVMDSVKASCKSQGINADLFIDQLSAYIDDCIKYANSLNK